MLFSTEITEINHGKSLAKGGSDREKLKKKMGHFFLTQGLINKKKNSPLISQIGSFFIREGKMKVEVARLN